MTDSPELDYDALCIDTSIFHQTGYALEKGLVAQLEQFAQSPVQVVISEVVDKEMKRHMTERIRAARIAFEKGLKEAEQEMLVSVGSIERTREAALTRVTAEEVARRRLDEFYERCDAMVLPADAVATRAVLDRYFNHEPPFAASGDKKQEFPDAYALMSIESWAQEKKFNVLVVSYDKGWKEFCEKSERLVYYDDLGLALKFFQPHNAAPQLIAELNESLISGVDDYGILANISDSVKGSVEAMEIDVEADSQFYWEPDEVYARYKDHHFRRSSLTQAAIDLVRVTEHEVVVRLTATIKCGVHASFALSMTDPIDKDEVSMGSQSAEVEQVFDSDVLVTFEGEFSQGLRGVSVESVELTDEMPTVEFGEIELDWGREDEDFDRVDLAVEDEN